MYNNTLDGISAYVQQQVCNPPVQSTDQHDANAENYTHSCIMLILMTY